MEWENEKQYQVKVTYYFNQQNGGYYWFDVVGGSKYSLWEAEAGEALGIIGIKSDDKEKEEKLNNGDVIFNNQIDETSFNRLVNALKEKENLHEQQSLWSQKSSSLEEESIDISSQKDQQVYFSIKPLYDEQTNLAGYQLVYQLADSTQQKDIKLSPQQAQQFAKEFNIKEIPVEGMKSQAGKRQFFEALKRVQQQSKNRQPNQFSFNQQNRYQPRQAQSFVFSVVKNPNQGQEVKNQFPYLLVTNRPIPGFEFIGGAGEHGKLLGKAQYEQLIKVYPALKVNESAQEKKSLLFEEDEFGEESDQLIDKNPPLGGSKKLVVNVKQAQKIFYLVNGINQNNRSGETQKDLMNAFNHRFEDELASNDIPENVLPSYLGNFGYNTFPDNPPPKQPEKPKNPNPKNKGGFSKAIGVPILRGGDYEYTRDIKLKPKDQILQESQLLHQAQNELGENDPNFKNSEHFRRKLEPTNNQLGEEETLINLDEEETEIDDTAPNQSNSNLEERVKQIENATKFLMKENSKLKNINYELVRHVNINQQISAFKELIEQCKQQRSEREAQVQKDTTRKALQLTPGQKAATFFGGLIVGGVIGAVCGQFLGGLFSAGGGVPVVGIIVFFATLLIVGAIINRVMAAGFRNKNQAQAFMNQNEKSGEHNKILIADVKNAVRQAVQRAFEAWNTEDNDKDLLQGVIEAAKADFKNWKTGNGNGAIYWGLRQWMHEKAENFKNFQGEKTEKENFQEHALEFFAETLNQISAMTPHQNMTHQQYKQLKQDPQSNMEFNPKVQQALQQGRYVELQPTQDDDLEDGEIENLQDENPNQFGNFCQNSQDKSNGKGNLPGDEDSIELDDRRSGNRFN